MRLLKSASRRCLKTDIKKWLEGAGEPVADTCFPPGKAPVMPYVVFLDSMERTGGDMKNMICRHSLTVERYSAADDYNTALEALFNAKALKYKRERQWLSTEGCYFTTYNMENDLIEREAI